MRRFLTTIAIAGILSAPIAASAIELEDGATFYDNGTCQEADGTFGLSEASGQCITPADYDIIFGYDNLSTVENLSTPGVSVAEAYGITQDSPKASDRARIFMGVDYGSFTETVIRLSRNLGL